MAAEGLHQPIGIRGPDTAGLYEIIYGHRRYLAAELLRWLTIDARVYPLDYDPLLAAISENLNREDMTPVDEANAVARFVARGEPDAAIARLFRKSLSWVRTRRDLITYPDDLRTAVAAKTITLGDAAALTDIDHADYRKSLIQEAIRTGATAATAEVWRQHYLTDRERIIGNNLVIQDILERREAWKIVVACDLCDTDHDYPDTVSIRVCRTCRNELAAVKAETTPNP